MSSINTHHIYRLYTLLLLKSNPRHGYEIIATIEENTGNKPSTSHIYPFLGDLDSQGYVETTTGKRGKKTYSLTAEGNAFVNEQMNAFGNMLHAAIQDDIHECTHCDCKIYEDGYELDGELYCCQHCATASKA